MLDGQEGVIASVASEQPAAQAAPGVNTQVASEPVGVNTASPENVPAQPAQPATEQSVPYDRFKEVNEAKKELERQNEVLRLQQQIAQQQPQPQQQQGPTLYDQVVKELGLESEEYLNKDQQGKVFLRMQEITEARTQQTLAQQTFLSQHPDFAEVVGAISPLTGQFVPSQALTSVLLKNPMLGAAVQSSPYAYALLYQIVSNDPDYRASKVKPPVPNVAQAAAQILRQPGQLSISNVQGGGNVDKAATVANMTDAEFTAYKNEIMSRAR